LGTDFAPFLPFLATALIAGKMGATSNRQESHHDKRLIQL
jgi:hypothetical protein